MDITTLGIDLAKSVFNFTALIRMASWFCKRSYAVALFSISCRSWNPA